MTSAPANANAPARPSGGEAYVERVFVVAAALAAIPVGSMAFEHGWPALPWVVLVSLAVVTVRCRRARHLPWVWLLGNCGAVSVSAWVGPLWLSGCVIALAWLVCLLTAVAAVFVARALDSVVRAASVVACVVGVAVHWTAPWVGPSVRVWWEQEALLLRMRAKLTSPVSPDAWPYCDVDRGDDPPQRAAEVWFAAHGDVAGVAYDPTGRLAAGTRWEWLYGARTRHLFGPWYAFTNGSRPN